MEIRKIGPCIEKGLGAPRRIRTSDLKLRKLALYPTELWAQMRSFETPTQCTKPTGPLQDEADPLYYVYDYVGFADRSYKRNE